MFAPRIRVSILLLSSLLPFVARPVCVGQERAQLPRSTPEQQGVSSSQLLKFVKALDQEVNSIHSVMVVRNGQVIAEAWWKPESADKAHVLWSLSKSFTSTAVGLAIHEKKLTLDDRVIDFFKDELPDPLPENLDRMRIRDLLTMSAGHQKEVNWRAARNWAKAFLEHPVPHQPGTHFQYNTPATYMLSAIVQSVTGETVNEYLGPRLFEPLGIEQPRWDKSPQGVSLGGYGLFLKTEDIAKFGQLLLQEGQWQGQQLVPKSWVAMATSKQVSNGTNPNSDWQQGYGFQFWRCRHNAFRGDGKDGQFCIVIPDQNAVVVMTANTSNMQAELSLVWEHLLPAFSDEPLQAEPAELKKLEAYTSTLEASR